MMFFFFCFFKQKTAYEMRISDWSSDVCSSDLIQDYFVKVVDDYHLRPHIRFGTECERLVYDEADASWSATLAGPHGRRETISADVVISAVGIQIGRASCRERVCQYV